MAKGCGCGMAGVRKPAKRKAKKTSCVYLVGEKVHRTKKAATKHAKRAGVKVRKSCTARLAR